MSFLFCLAATPAQAGETWHCRNKAAEVTCNVNACAVSKDFTPLDVTVDREAGLSICAYSGCWEGKTTLELVASSHLTVYSDRLRWSTDSEKPAIAGSVTIDRKAGFGTILVDRFAVPMTCRKDK